eukprot:CAMPEP_0185563618 /NCGR_PEP_ID=MMETSP1381-20130426/63845_1 /TAXON_ID=298111 /ORGANISM="Pavlova sp., Strain CCMP459" /LENGTH=47 /DNA_ID=CAMNT_0028177511 /DNA_START=99 /DNA_END=239 /DNA_ORIENTATION=+
MPWSPPAMPCLRSCALSPVPFILSLRLPRQPKAGAQHLVDGCGSAGP